MSVCGQCHCEHSLGNRLVEEQCGHLKCRQCFINDEKECSQCKQPKTISTGLQVEVPSTSNKMLPNNNSKEAHVHIIEFNSNNSNRDGVNEYHCRAQMCHHLRANPKGSGPPQKYKCQHCGKDYPKRTALKYHLQSHAEVPYKCNDCHKVFRNLLVLKKHEKLHQLIPIPCLHCGRTFRGKDILKTHIASFHSTTMPFKCNVCGKRYASKPSYKLHLLKHNKEKRFSCEICGITFQRKWSLKMHLTQHTTKEVFDCDLCQKQYTNAASFQRHITTQHKSKNAEESLSYFCRQCNTSSVRKDNMKRHVKHLHPEAEFNEIVEVIELDKMNRNEDKRKSLSNIIIDSGCEANMNNIEKQSEPLDSCTSREEVHTNHKEDCAVPLLKTVANSSVIKCIGNVEPMHIPQVSLMNGIPAVIEQDFMDEITEEADGIRLEPISNGNNYNVNTRLPNIELYRRILEDCDDLLSEEEDEERNNHSQDTETTNINRLPLNIKDVIKEEGEPEQVHKKHLIENQFNTNTVVKSPENRNDGERKSLHHNDKQHTMLHWRKSYKYFYESEFNK